MPKLYGSVLGLSKEIKKLYGGVHLHYTKYIVTGFANNQGFNSNTFMNKYNSTYGLITEQPTRLDLTTVGSTTYVFLRFANDSQSLFQWTGTYANQGVVWGFNNGVYSGDAYSTSTQVDEDVSKKITKLYGSVNGQTKLIYEE